jgi:asparaginyl-tRNA synthetase
MTTQTVSEPQLTNTIRITDALAGKAAVGSDVTIKGWVRTRRDSKAGGGLSFINVHDGSCFDPIQVVADKSLSNYESDVLRITTGCSVIVAGTLASSQGKGQAVEIQAKSIQVLGWVDDPDTYPVSAKRHTFEYLREVAHLRPRTNTFGAIARVRHTLAMAVHRFFHERGFYWIHTPIITASDCEGAGEMFRVSTLDQMNLPRKADEPKHIDYAQDFFGKESFLTVSGQLNVETYCLALSNVYTFGPTFRAENSNTSRHLAEFWMIEPEIAFADLNADADLAENFLKYIFRALLNERPDDMAFFAQHIDKDCINRLEKFINSSFERMNYGDAIKAIEAAVAKGKKFEFPVKWGTDLQSEHERYLTEELVGRPVVVMNYPKDIKAFYMRMNDDGKTVAAMDVLAPGIGEIIGGSQREERLDVLDARLDEMKLPKAAYWWYRDLRRYGTVPHAGFGLGFERTIIYATGMQNIRDVIPFPRTPKNAEF